MAVLRLTRFMVKPADTEEMLAARAVLIAALRKQFPGLLEARLAKLGNDTWIDVWSWDSLASAETAFATASAIPEAAASFPIVKDVTVEYGEVVDAR